MERGRGEETERTPCRDVGELAFGNRDLGHNGQVTCVSDRSRACLARAQYEVSAHVSNSADVSADVSNSPDVWADVAMKPGLDCIAPCCAVAGLCGACRRQRPGNIKTTLPLLGRSDTYKGGV